jgi:ABC-type dipeptide/oligopeptide/nickel transport system permease component
MLSRYVTRRILIFPLQLIAISLIVFFVMRALPADPVAHLVGVNATPEAIASVRDDLDLDQSVFDQLLIYLGLESGDTGPGLIHGSLGKSWNSGQRVADEIASYLPVTLELISYSFLLALAISIPLGLISALKSGGRIDRVITGYGLFAGAQPEFWWGLAFIFVFYVTLHLVPAPIGRLDFSTHPPPSVTGMITVDSLIAGNLAALIDGARHLVLPVITLAFVLSGPITKMVRQNVLKTVQSDFIMYAESCGLPQKRIAGYTFKNSLAPCLTLIGILFAYMLSGAVLVEQVFSLNGLGSYAVKSVLSFDFPAIQGIVLVITVATLLILLILDVAHAMIDPRIARA